MDPSTHFIFGIHHDHGFVARIGPNMPMNLGNWFLTREQFEQVPGTPGLYRLTNPETDGPRRTRQAVHDLRELGCHVHSDFSLDPAATPDPPQPTVRNGLMERRTRIARAAAVRSPQNGPALTTTPPTARPVPPKPAYAPTAATPPGRHGHGRRT
ncbi:hypothetical protein ACIRQP_35010 [Streptomyces sp. NPDC102274]|uniref:hypothetical protein n=1 Tax=Streptomyces sp. NPDC102274 TaxID=3366151 RepID=UPI003806789D